MYNLMIVDDEPLVIKAITYIINNNFSKINISGHAGDGLTAIEMAREKKPDIIFMDIKLKGLNGLEAIKEIKKFLPESVIIIISAYDDFNYAQKAIKYGTMDYILKPINKKDIIDILAKVIEHLDLLKEEQKSYLVLKEKLEEKDNNYHFCPPLQLEKKLFQAIEVGDIIEIEVSINKIVNYLAKIASLQEMKIYLKELIAVCLRLIHRYLPAQKINLIKIHQLQEEIDNFLNQDELLGFIKQIFLSFSNMVSPEASNDINPVLLKAKKYIEKNYNQDLNLKEIANYVSISPSYLSKLFKDYYNSTFIDYLTRTRIKKAIQLIQENKYSVKEIAMMVGYHDANYFSKVFKKITGQPPSHFQR